MKRVLAFAIPILLAVITYFAAARRLGIEELWLLFRRDRAEST